ncbi:hypothetical protein HK105_200203 [Polyrhizophydium stewartii]|uniref:Aminotransferase class V domain-containing protein n=1 Tax=Polyrhizophydium stewartii TaxID=2732419 RepID=A0ABR4NKT2_9FUNG
MPPQRRSTRVLFNTPRPLPNVPRPPPHAPEGTEAAKLFDSLLDIPLAARSSPKALAKFLHTNMMLAPAVATPYGQRPLVYADNVASGRPLRCVEDAIASHVLPFYANTHTETGLLGRLMMDLREAARSIVKSTCHADPDQYACIFAGTGTTGAVYKLASILCPRATDETDPDQRPVVFISIAEHHSNILVWSEAGAKVVTIDTDENGIILLPELEAGLRKYESHRTIIGSFSAASNIAPVEQPVAELTRLMHRYGGIAVFDYACAGPYADIRMCPSSDENDWVDAVMISPHKFFGGPGTPGVLLMRKSLYTRSTPSIAGGGTVAWVNATGQAYLGDLEAREEGGTPDIIGAIRAGFALHIKSLLTPEFIRQRQRELTNRATTFLSRNPNVIILGPTHDGRMPVFSFLVKSPIPGKLLHHNFVSRVLSDVFGVQTRSGCSCAGPYYFRLVGMSEAEETSKRTVYLDTALEGVKPGFTRFNLSVTHSEAEVDFILQAVDWVASHGFRLLPVYHHEVTTANWIPRVTEPAVVNATIRADRKPVRLDAAQCVSKTEEACLAFLAQHNETDQPFENIEDEAVLEKLEWYATDADVMPMIESMLSGLAVVPPKSLISRSSISSLASAYSSRDFKLIDKMGWMRRAMNHKSKVSLAGAAP